MIRYDDAAVQKIMRQHSGQQVGSIPSGWLALAGLYEQTGVLGSQAQAAAPSSILTAKSKVPELRSLSPYAQRLVQTWQRDAAAVERIHHRGDQPRALLATRNGD